MTSVRIAAARIAACAVLALAAVFAAGSAARPAAAAPALVWAPDIVHSRAEFLISHLIVSKVWGHVPIRALRLESNADGVPTAIDATLAPGNLDTDNHERDADLRSAAYFDVERFPTMTFVSRRITAAGKDAFTCEGDLTIRGTTRPVTLAGRIEGRIPDPAGERIGYTATTTIDRRDFGIADARTNPAGIPLVGNDVQITLTVEAVRTKSGTPG